MAKNDFSFFIYDYESFGVNPATDRPAQFGGIRTDADFNIIGEPVVLYCKQTNDYLPSPEAVLVTGLKKHQPNASPTLPLGPTGLCISLILHKNLKEF